MMRLFPVELLWSSWLEMPSAPEVTVGRIQPAPHSCWNSAEFAEILLRALGSGMFDCQYHPSPTQETSGCLLPSEIGSRKALVLGNYPVLLIWIKVEDQSPVCHPG